MSDVLRLKCYNCGSVMRTLVRQAGKRSRCPSCDAPFRIPPAEAFERFAGKKVRAPKEPEWDLARVRAKREQARREMLDQHASQSGMSRADQPPHPDNAASPAAAAVDRNDPSEAGERTTPISVHSASVPASPSDQLPPDATDPDPASTTEFQQAGEDPFAGLSQMDVMDLAAISGIFDDRPRGPLPRKGEAKSDVVTGRRTSDRVGSSTSHDGIMPRPPEPEPEPDDDTPEISQSTLELLGLDESSLEAFFESRGAPRSDPADSTDIRRESARYRTNGAIVPVEEESSASDRHEVDLESVDIDDEGSDTDFQKMMKDING